MYWAKAVRVKDGLEGQRCGDLFDRDARGVRVGIIADLVTNHPEVERGWTMQEDIARDTYNITELEIDESRAWTSSGIVNI